METADPEQEQMATPGALQGGGDDNEVRQHARNNDDKVAERLIARCRRYAAAGETECQRES